MKKILLGMLSIGLFNAASASDFALSPYIGLSAGFSQMKHEHVEENYRLSSSDSANNFAAFAGLRWQDSDGFFIDTELKGRLLKDSVVYGQGQIDQYTIDASTTSIGGTIHAGKWITSHMSLYGLLGANHNMIKYKDVTHSAENKFSYQSMELGLGSDFRLTDQILLVGRITYDQAFDKHGNDYVDIERNHLNLNAGVKFEF